MKNIPGSETRPRVSWWGEASPPSRSVRFSPFPDPPSTPARRGRFAPPGSCHRKTSRPERQGCTNRRFARPAMIPLFGLLSRAVGLWFGERFRVGPCKPRNDKRREVLSWLLLWIERSAPVAVRAKLTARSRPSAWTTGRPRSMPTPACRAAPAQATAPARPSPSTEDANEHGAGSSRPRFFIPPERTP